MHTTSPASSPEKSSTRGVGEYFIAETFSWEISLLSDGFFLDYFSPQTPFPLRTTDVLTFVWCILINKPCLTIFQIIIKSVPVHEARYIPAILHFVHLSGTTLKGLVRFRWNLEFLSNKWKKIADWFLALIVSLAPVWNLFSQHSSVCWPKSPMLQDSS